MTIGGTSDPDVSGKILVLSAYAWVRTRRRGGAVIFPRKNLVPMDDIRRANTKRLLTSHSSDATE